MENKNTTVDSLNLIGLLNVHGMQQVPTLQFVKENLFDTEKLDVDSQPEIVTKEKCIIIFDNECFNETYLIDIVNKIFDDFPEVKVKTFYADNCKLRCEMFNVQYPITMSVSEIEKRLLKPGIMVINPETGNINFLPEGFTPLDEMSIYKFLNFMINGK